MARQARDVRAGWGNKGRGGRARRPGVVLYKGPGLRHMLAWPSERERGEAEGCR